MDIFPLRGDLGRLGDPEDLFTDFFQKFWCNKVVQNLFLVSFFGLSGILLRYSIDQFFSDWNDEFPVTTLAINLLGSFAAGTVYAWIEHREVSSALQVGLLIGFCGGFTTFSAYALQTLNMIERGRIIPAFMYLFLSPVLGLIMAFIPVLLTRKLST